MPIVRTNSRAAALGLAYCIVLGLGAGAAQASLNPQRALTSFIHQSWQTSQGLPQNSVLALAQTGDGYLWVGTEEGLARFDGARFSMVGQGTGGLQNKTVTALVTDQSGNLWIGTNGGGLSRYKNGRFETLTTRNGLPNNSILCLHEDAKGVVWIGTDGGGLASVERGHLRSFTKTDGLPDNVVFSIAGQKDGTLWIGTRAGLARYASGTFSVPEEAGSLLGKHVRAVVCGQHGAIWVGTDGDGLFQIKGKELRHFQRADGLGSEQIISLFQDLSGTLWIGTLNTGLVRYANNVFSSTGDKPALLGTEVHAILEDREGNLWAGTAGGGLDCLKEGVFSDVSKQDGLPSDTILPILQDSAGNLWIGSDRGLTFWRNGHATTYTSRDGLADDLVLSLTQDASGAIWAGTRRGLCRYKDNRFTTFTTKDGLGSDFIVSLLEDHSGNLWIGSRGGLTKYDGRFSTYTTRDGLSNNYVLAIAEDGSGGIWAGTEGGGANVLKSGRFKVYKTQNGLSNDVVRAIYADTDGTVWFATNGGGLNRLRNGHFTAYKTDRGLFDDSLHSIVPDGLGRLWFTCNRGVFSLYRKQLDDFAEGRVATITPRVYGTADGLRTNEFNGGFQPASCRLRDGRLLFPSTGGVAIIDPTFGRQKIPPPVPVIERVLIDQRDFAPGTSIVVPPGKGQLEIQFTAPTFRSPESIQFSYILEGFDKEWTQAGNRRTAYYTNIPPGEYRFQVRGNTGEASGGTETSLPLTLQPHFYQTLTFYALTGLIIVGLCAATYGWRVNELRNRENMLVRLVNEKTTALRESERLLRRSRDELEIRVQERTIELVRANQALQTEIFVRRQAETQLRTAKEEADAATQGLKVILSNVGRELLLPVEEIRNLTETRLDKADNEREREYLNAVSKSAFSLDNFIHGLANADTEEDSKALG